jgi:hydrocephalus-inducing protein
LADCLQVLDVEEALGVAHSMAIAIKGEAYKIELDLKFPQSGLSGVDFGSLR